MGAARPRVTQIEAVLKSAGAGWGNVVQFTTYLVHSQDIPRFMAWRLREFPRLFPDGKYPPNTLLVIDRLRRQQGLAAFERLHVVHPPAGLLVTNLSRLPVREIVFDAGPPVAFDILAPAERCAVVLPAEAQFAPAFGVVVADFDGDGDQDIFAGANGEDHQVWLNDGKGGFKVEGNQRF